MFFTFTAPGTTSTTIVQKFDPIAKVVTNVAMAPDQANNALHLERCHWRRAQGHDAVTWRSRRFTEISRTAPRYTKLAEPAVVGDDGTVEGAARRAVRGGDRRAALRALVGDSDGSGIADVASIACLT